MTHPSRRLSGRRLAAWAAIALTLALGGCGCRPGYVGPYGGVHAPRCYVG